jgi:predicted metal-dependent hydrolase
MAIKIYLDSDSYNLKCIISDLDGEKYCVRERSKLKDAANLLAETTSKMKQLVDYVANKYPDNNDVKTLVKRFNPTKISETLPTSEHTAYSENKGEKLAFCLNKHKNSDNKLIDTNTLLFVAIHELAHVMSNVEGHKQIFWQNFKFLLTEAKEAGIYVPVDYKKNPEPYCGMDITDNPYYDLV